MKTNPQAIDMGSPCPRKAGRSLERGKIRVAARKRVCGFDRPGLFS
jgi:hypothetical protein